jgi:phosphoketolase
MADTLTAQTTAVPQENRETPLNPEELSKIDRYWRAANYLSVGQIYLRDNALMREPLVLDTGEQHPGSTSFTRT